MTMKFHKPIRESKLFVINSEITKAYGYGHKGDDFKRKHAEKVAHKKAIDEIRIMNKNDKIKMEKRRKESKPYAK